MLYKSTVDTVNSLPDIYQYGIHVDMVITVYTGDPTSSDVSEANNSGTLKGWFHNLHTLLEHTKYSI